MSSCLEGWDSIYKKHGWEGTEISAGVINGKDYHEDAIPKECSAKQDIGEAAAEAKTRTKGEGSLS